MTTPDLNSLLLALPDKAKITIEREAKRISISIRQGRKRIYGYLDNDFMMDPDFPAALKLIERMMQEIFPKDATNRT